MDSNGKQSTSHTATLFMWERFTPMMTNDMHEDCILPGTFVVNWLDDARRQYLNDRGYRANCTIVPIPLDGDD